MRSVESQYVQSHENEPESYVSCEGHDYREDTNQYCQSREKPHRKATELGIFNAGKERWLSVSATTEQALEHYIRQAQAKGWQKIPMYEGTDPKTGWPTIWMKKPVAAAQAENNPSQTQPATC